MTKKNRAGFTLIELIIVIVIIATIITAAFIYFDNLLESGRDTRRVSDIAQIQNALKLYYRDEGQYPDSLTFGSALEGSNSSITYMLKVPQNPTPRNDGDCADSEYVYTRNVDLGGNEGYRLSFCLGGQTQTVSAGNNCATENGIAGNSLDCSGLNYYDGLALWLDASNPGSLFSDSGCSVPASDNDNVGCFKDKSGAGNNLIEANSGYQPIRNDSQVNGHPAVTFDGSDDRLTVNNPIVMGTVFIVANYTAGSTFVSYPGLITRATAIDGNTDYILVGAVSNTNFYGIMIPGGVELSINRLGTYNFAPLADHKITMVKLNALPTWGDLMLGNDRNFGGRFWQGDIAEVIIYDRVLDSAETAAIEDYLAEKYNITLP